MQRNKAFDLLKMAFTCVIVIHHSGYFFGVLNRGYIAVEFFFITSGYFLRLTYEKDRDLNTLDYYKKRAKRLYPEYWFAFIVYFIVLSSLHRLPYENWYSPILELLMLQNIGIPGLRAINGPCWYLSVLMVGGILIHFLLRKLSRHTFTSLSVLIISATYLYLVMHSPEIEQWDTVGYVFYIPFWRGMADMLIGTLIYQMPKPSGKIPPLIMECCSGAGVLMLLRLQGYYDYLTIVLIIILVWSIQADKSLLRSIGSFGLIKRLEKYQYSVYVNHSCVILLFNLYVNDRGINAWIITVMLLLAVFLVAIADKTITDKIIRRLSVIS